MFSKFFTSAKSFLADKSPTASATPPPFHETIAETMVTTTRKRDMASTEDELNEDNTIHVYVSWGSKKKQRREEVDHIPKPSKEEEDSPARTKKRKMLPVREKEADGLKPVQTIPVVEILVPSKKASSKRSQAANVKPVETLEIADSADEVDDENVEEVARSAASKTKKIHRRFDSEDAEEIFSTAPEPTEGQQIIDDDSEESDDEAPEAIGVQTAALDIRSKDEKAAKAVKEQLSATRRKRKQRHDTLKKQSESGKRRKQKIEEEQVGGDGLSDSAPAKMELDVENVAPQKDDFLGNRRNLPDLLPAEYLEDTEPRDLILLDERPKKNPKKINFQDLIAKQPKDLRINSTTYRVTKARSKNLAPKASVQARMTKEKWLQGRVGKLEKSSRKPFSSGFLKK